MPRRSHGIAGTRGLQFRRSSEERIAHVARHELSLATIRCNVYIYISLKLYRPAVLRFRSTIKLIWLSIRLVCIKADGPTTFSRPRWIVVKAGRTSCIRAHTRNASHRLHCTYLLPVVFSSPDRPVHPCNHPSVLPLSKFKDFIAYVASDRRKLLLSLHQFYILIPMFFPESYENLPNSESLSYR